MNRPKNRLLPLGPMAAHVGVRPHDLRADALSGDMPHVRVGKSGLLFDPARVFAVLAERARGADAQIRADEREKGDGDDR